MLLIANIHKQNTNYKMAFATAEKGLGIASAMHDTADIIALLGLQGMFTHSLWLSQNKRTVDNSLEYQLKALKIAESSRKYEKLRIRFYDNLAQYYKDNYDFATAISYGNKSVPLAKKYTQERSLTYVYTWLGEAYYRKGDHQKGLAYLDSALQTAYKIKEPYREMEIYMSLYDCALLSANYKQAIDYGTKFRQLHDSLQVSLNEKQIGELQIKYETAKKDKQILLLDHAEAVKSRQIVWILAGSCLFVVFIIVLLVQSRTIHRNNQIIKANNNQLNESLSSIAYIQSHELRKPLASIMGLVNVIKADDYHVDQDILSKLEEAANDLDKKIQNINTHTQANK
jgi:tetratricopeptide (TPR) repeat protein